MRLYGQVGVRKPLVTKRNQIKRLNWAKERQEWINKWDNIIWSDESKFELLEVMVGEGLTKNMM